ncbi:DUF2808 domain-containing protein [Leptolyngbya sp. DQ-M1]|uniref:DUF2808 domain-containing protein n=1 Tax=Leptolyngbya sp. DQ-M1 TaxID=2933920 RepID=UPI0032987B07
MFHPFNALLSFQQSRLAHAITLTAGLVSLSTSLAVAGQHPAGQFFFDHAPRLVRAETNAIPITYVGGAAYEFTIAVPQDAGAPLQAVAITQDGNPRTIEFNLNRSRAIAGNGTNIPLESIGGNQNTATTIAFAQPIQPGETVTVSLKSDRNPSSEGVYLFGITAYPAGDQEHGLFLGHGRVQIYSQGR